MNVRATFVRSWMTFLAVGAGLVYLLGWADFLITGRVDPGSASDVLGAVPESFVYFVKTVLPVWWAELLVGPIVLATLWTGVRWAWGKVVRDE